MKLLKLVAEKSGTTFGDLPEVFNRLFGRRSNKASTLCVTGVFVGNSRVTGEFPAQMASNAGQCFHLITSPWLFGLELRNYIGIIECSKGVNLLKSYEIMWCSVCWKYHGIWTSALRQNNNPVLMSLCAHWTITLAQRHLVWTTEDL